eukprot:420853-Pelagomonas_calceolata.AAC.1
MLAVKEQKKQSSSVQKTEAKEYDQSPKPSLTRAVSPLWLEQVLKRHPSVYSANRRLGYL